MPTLQKKIVKGHTYWYIVTSKRVKGKPTPVVLKYLGTIENILKHYSSTEKGEIEYKSYSHGEVFALWEIAKKYKILQMMRKHFKKTKRSGADVSKTLLLAAIHRVCQPGSKRSFSDFANETTLPAIAKFNADKFTSQLFWDQMDEVDSNEIEAFQKSLTKALHKKSILEIEKLSFDTTNFFTYIDSGNTRNKRARRGRNKQKRNDLRQFSLALIISKDFFIPLSSYVYEGNITDVTVFSPYIKYLSDKLKDITEPDKLTVIFDKGCCSKKNLKEIEEKNFHYISAFSIHHKKDLTEVQLEDYESVKVGEKDILTYKKDETIWEKERTVVLYYSNKLHQGQIRGLNNSIEKKKDKLRALQKGLKSKHSKIKTKAHLEQKIARTISGEYGSELFKTTVHQKPLGFDFSIDQSKYDFITGEIYGKKAIITDQADWDTADILQSYFGQSEIEKTFKHLKNTDHHSIRPQYHWTDQKIQVHVFICLLGFLLTSLLQRDLAEYGCKYEKEKILDLLRKVRKIDLLRLNNSKKKKKAFETKLEKMDEEPSFCYKTLLKALGKKES